MRFSFILATVLHICEAYIPGNSYLKMECLLPPLGNNGQISVLEEGNATALLRTLSTWNFIANSPMENRGITRGFAITSHPVYQDIAHSHKERRDATQRESGQQPTITCRPCVSFLYNCQHMEKLNDRRKEELSIDIAGLRSIFLKD